jgi:hypothetical protein
VRLFTRHYPRQKLHCSRADSIRSTIGTEILGGRSAARRHRACAEVAMSQGGVRLVAIFLASILAFALGTDAQARRHRFARSAGHHHFAGFAGRPGMGAAALDAGHSAHDHFAHNNFRGGFGYGNGWYGPVFWPHAYDDVFNDILWGYGLGGPFWDY